MYIITIKGSYRMIIKVLGTGCPNCQKLEALARAAVVETGLNAEIEKVTNIADISAHGVIRTPGLIINDTIVSQGKIPTLATLKHWILDATRD